MVKYYRSSVLFAILVRYLESEYLLIKMLKGDKDRTSFPAPENALEDVWETSFLQISENEEILAVRSSLSQKKKMSGEEFLEMCADVYSDGDPRLCFSLIVISDEEEWLILSKLAERNMEDGLATFVSNRIF